MEEEGIGAFPVLTLACNFEEGPGRPMAASLASLIRHGCRRFWELCTVHVHHLFKGFPHRGVLAAGDVPVGFVGGKYRVPGRAAAFWIDSPVNFHQSHHSQGHAILEDD